MACLTDEMRIQVCQFVRKHYLYTSRLIKYVTKTLVTDRIPSSIDRDMRLFRPRLSLATIYNGEIGY